MYVSPPWLVNVNRVGPPVLAQGGAQVNPTMVNPETRSSTLFLPDTLRCTRTLHPWKMSQINWFMPGDLWWNTMLQGLVSPKFGSKPRTGTKEAYKCFFWPYRTCFVQFLVKLNIL